MIKENISNRYASVRENISEVCHGIGVNPDDICVVAVTKTFSPEIVEAALKSGITHIGENRIQEAETKTETVHRFNGKYHLIGHLQSNKAKKAVGLFDMIQSMDSVKIAKIISDGSIKLNRKMEVLLQINCTGEETKFGFHPDAIVDAADEIRSLPGLIIRGMMTIGPWVDDEDMIRSDFILAKKRFDEIAGRYPDADMRYLSMGMSGDYHIALQEGANMLRLGSVIFGPRSINK